MQTNSCKLWQNGNWKVSLKFILALPSVEIQFFCISEFYVKSILKILDAQNVPVWHNHKALNLDLHEFWHFLKSETDQINKVKSLKNGKKGSFRTSRFSKIWFHVKYECPKILKFSYCHFFQLFTNGTPSLCSRNFQNVKLRLDFVSII